MRRRGSESGNKEDKGGRAEALDASGPAPIAIYKALRKHFGFLDWWPGDTDFEILVGAILAQQTSWKNVETALANIKRCNSLSIKKMAGMPIARMQLMIRPSGFYRQKAKRLRNLCRTILNEHGSLENLLALEKDDLRKVLLSYNGIGKETADSIILYAAHKPIFVIDAYTRRAMHRINPAISKDIGYDGLRLYFESRIGCNTPQYKDFHAQFVELGKNYCRKSKPLCQRCPLSEICSLGIETNRKP